MIIQEVPFDSSLYEAMRRFREETLRRPLGLVLGVKDVEGEDRQIHIAAVGDDAGIAGAVLLKPLSDSHVKLRQMAVSPSLRGSGLGKNLVRFAEELARAKGFRIMEMHARVCARGFYEKLGYGAVGEEFIEVTVPTVKMSKAL